MAKSVFGFVKAEDSPGFLLWQTTITWQRLIKKALDPHHISHAQFVILAITLWHENHNEEVSQSLLIHQSKLDKMTISKALKKLATQSYIQHVEHHQDTRAKSVHLTKKGKTMAAKLVPLIEQIDKAFFGTIVKSEQQSLIGILHSLVSKANAAT